MALGGALLLLLLSSMLQSARGLMLRSAAVAALMKLPKAERLEALVAMSQECVSRQQDAAPLLQLIQLELNSPDDDEAPASRPVSSASIASKPPAPPAKSVRRQLKEKRDELRAMLIPLLLELAAH